MTARPVHPVDVLLLLVDGDHVLMALREGTGYADGQWNLPSGKLELHEDAVSAIIRVLVLERGGLVMLSVVAVG